MESSDKIRSCSTHYRFTQIPVSNPVRVPRRRLPCGCHNCISISRTILDYRLTYVRKNHCDCPSWMYSALLARRIRNGAGALPWALRSASSKTSKPIKIPGNFGEATKPTRNNLVREIPSGNQNRKGLSTPAQQLRVHGLTPHSGARRFQI
jgi:hypothetical protein